MRNLVLVIATGVGSGYSPIAPGTAGSVVGLALYLPLVAVLGGPGFAYLGAVAVVTAVGMWAAGHAERIFESEDDGRITVDEVAGQLLALAWLPVRPDVWIASFFLFRLFDIVKPPPARQAEALHGGVGVVTDDLVAGLYANLVGQLLWRVLFPSGLWPDGLWPSWLWSAGLW